MVTAMAKLFEDKKPSMLGEISAAVASSYAPALAASALAYPVTKDVSRWPIPGNISLAGDGYQIHLDPAYRERLIREGRINLNHPRRVVERIKVDGVPLRDYLRSHDIGLYSDSAFGKGLSGHVFLDRGDLDKLKSSGIDAFNGLGDKSKGTVVVGFKEGTKPQNVVGLTGHEVGHAIRHARRLSFLKLYKWSKIGSRYGGIIGSARTAMGRSSGEEAAAITAGNMLLAAPMLHEELAASRLGSKLVGLKGLSRLRSFKGVPSYLAVSAAPGITWGARRLIDKIRGVKKPA